MQKIESLSSVFSSERQRLDTINVQEVKIEQIDLKKTAQRIKKVIIKKDHVKIKT